MNTLRERTSDRRTDRQCRTGRSLPVTATGGLSLLPIATESEQLVFSVLR